jgi:hypothetical protein
MDLAEMEKRLRALEDLEEIKKLQRRYMQHHDHLEFTQILDLFTDDAEVEVRSSGVLKGKENFKKIFLHTLGDRRLDRHDGHLVGEPVLTVDGDTARGHWTVYMFFSVPKIEWVQGRNDCEYVKVGGVWKISKLKFTRTLASDPKLYP